VTERGEHQDSLEKFARVVRHMMASLVESSSFADSAGIPAMIEGPRASGFVELPHLATFATVAERGGFTAAAADLGVTQAAVSQRIAMFEKELRVSLFDRRAGRISLSEAGQRLYQYAREILDLHGQARTDLCDFRPTFAGVEFPLYPGKEP